MGGRSVPPPPTMPPPTLKVPPWGQGEFPAYITHPLGGLTGPPSLAPVRANTEESGDPGTGSPPIRIDTPVGAGVLMDPRFGPLTLTPGRGTSGPGNTQRGVSKARGSARGGPAEGWVTFLGPGEVVWGVALSPCRFPPPPPHFPGAPEAIGRSFYQDRAQRGGKVVRSGRRPALRPAHPR